MDRSEQDLVEQVRGIVDANRYLTLAEHERAIATYSRRSDADGAGQLHGPDVVAPAPHRLYRARALQHFVLGPDDRRILVQLP
jgi:hypothetical protein